MRYVGVAGALILFTHISMDSLEILFILCLIFLFLFGPDEATPSGTTFLETHTYTFMEL